MQIEITSACNHRCIHCYNFWREPNEAIGTLRRENLLRIIQNLSLGDVQDLVITGGEPLLFPELVFEAIDRAHEVGMVCYLNTNLTLMTDEIAQEIAKRGVPILTSFLSHDPATFDAIAQKEGAFERVLNGIKIAQAHNIPVTANMVVMQQNYEHIVPTGRFLYGQGVTSFTATKVHPSQSCKRFNKMQLKPDQVRGVFDALLELKKELGINIDSLTCHPMCLLGNIDKYKDLVLKRSCSAGIVGGVVGADGGVRPCTHADEIYGNAVVESILDIWPRMRGWRDGTYLPDGCKACQHLKLCGGGCRMDAKYFHKNKNAMDPYAKKDKANQIVLPSPQPLPPVDVEQPLALHPLLRFREETFGTIVRAGKATRIVTKESEKILSTLVNQTFTVAEVIERYDLDDQEAKEFFSELVAEELVISAKQRKKTLACLC